MNQEQATIPLNEHLRKMYQEILLNTGAAAIFFSSFETTEHIMKVLADADVRFKVLLGRYDGKYETAYTIAAENLEWLFASGLVDGQESVMLLGEDGVGHLMFNQLDETGSPKLESLGEIINISKEDAALRTGFTFDPEDGLYYGTVQSAKVA